MLIKPKSNQIGKETIPMEWIIYFETMTTAVNELLNKVRQLEIQLNEINLNG